MSSTNALRNEHLTHLRAGVTFDVLVLGAGINGAVSAAALAGHGARVALVDARDDACVVDDADDYDSNDDDNG